MAKAEKIISALEKLYVKRSALDSKIADTEKKFIAEAKKELKNGSVPASKKTSPGRRGRKPRVSKTSSL